MKNKFYKTKVRQIAGSIALLSVVASGYVHADVMVIKKSSKGQGNKPAATAKVVNGQSVPNSSHALNYDLKNVVNNLNVTSTGGLLYGNPDKDVCWFHLSGLARFDEVIYSGSYRDTGFGVANTTDSLQSGAHIRAAQLFVDGSFAPGWEFTVGADFSSSGNVRFQDTWIAYSGFSSNNEVAIGRVSGSWFGLDSANSTTWMPFMERSLQSNAFYPGDGIGLMSDWWWCDGAFTLVAHQPESASRDQQNALRDRWVATARATYAPVHNEGDIWHFGISGAWKEAKSNTQNNLNRISFRSHPGLRARNTPYLLATGDIALANNAQLYNVEFARQCGPLMLEAEYTSTYVHRASGEGTQYQAQGALGSLRFHGYNVQGRFMLTGESHAYDVRDGAFGKVKPRSPYGAWEIAARYDYLNLGDKDIYGGSQRNASVALSWFINEQVRLTTNYIRANIRPRNGDIQRHVDIFGFRAQVRFK